MGYFALPPENASVSDLVATAEANVQMWRDLQPDDHCGYLLSMAATDLNRASDMLPKPWQEDVCCASPQPNREDK